MVSWTKDLQSKFEKSLWNKARHVLTHEFSVSTSCLKNTLFYDLLQAVSQSLQMHCKCHGVSGTCNIRTCWKSLPSKFIEVGKKLVNEYSRAIEIKAGVRTGSLRYSSTNDLVYVTKSPDYCNADPKLGSYGTSGRWVDKINFYAKKVNLGRYHFCIFFFLSFCNNN